MSTYDDQGNFRHPFLKERARIFLKEYFKLKDEDIIDCDNTNKSQYIGYPRTDFMLNINGEQIPVEVGNITTGNLDLRPGGINERLMQILKKYGKLIHIPFPQDNIFGIPVYNVIIFDFKHSDLLPYMKREIEEMSKKLEEIKEKVRIIDKIN